MKKIIVIILLVFVVACDTFRKEGQGIKEGGKMVSFGIACTTVGLVPCAVVGAILGYADGKEKTRDKIKDEQIFGLLKKKDKLILDLTRQKNGLPLCQHFWSTNCVLEGD
jgi:predicted small secreted protein